MQFLLNVILWCWCMQQAVAWRSFTFRMLGVRCAQGPSNLSFFNCSVSSVGSRKDRLSFHMKLANDIEEPKLDFLITIMRANQLDFVLFNVTDFDGCKFLESTGSFNILQILRKEFEKFAEIPNQCPVRKDTEIHLKDFTMDPEDFPPYVPHVGFSAFVQMRERLTQVFEMSVSGRVEPKNRGTKFSRRPQ